MIFQYALSGMSQNEIARTMGINQATVSRAITRTLKARDTANAQAMIDIELARLDAALAAIWPQVLRGALGAVDRFVSISRRRSEITGIDAPAKRSIDGSLSGSIEHSADDSWRQVVDAVMIATADDPDTRYKIAERLERLALVAGE